MDEFRHLLGRVCLTPYDPAGLVLIREVYVVDVSRGGEWMADGIFLGDHNGYRNGSIARYYAKELKPTWLCVSTIRDGMFAGEIKSLELRNTRSMENT